MATLTIAPTSVALPLSVSGGLTAWRPSRLRTIRLLDFAGPPQRAAAGVPIPLAWPNHAAGEVLEYTIDFGEPLDPEADSTAEASPAGLVVQALVLTGSLFTVWLQGGISGTQFAIALAAVTANGRAWRRTVSLYCL